MVAHTGLFLEPIETAEDPNNSGDLVVDPAIFDLIEAGPFILGIHAAGVSSIISQVHIGLIAPEGPSVSIGSIFFFPVDSDCLHKINAGVISTDVQFVLRFWNSSPDTARSLDTITFIDPTSLLLDNATLPIDLTAGSDLFLNLTIQGEGPPTTDTTIQFIIDGELFILSVFAQRLQPLQPYFEPNWNSPVKLSYAFQTVLDRSKTWFERRRPLFNNVKRSQECSFLFNADDAQQVSNDLRRFHESFLAVPIYPEALEVANTPIVGALTLTFNVAISGYYNLVNLSTILLMKSTKDPNINETFSIVAVDEILNTLTLNSPVPPGFVDGETFIFPIFIGVIDKFAPQYITDDLIEFTLKFDEIRRKVRL